MSYIFISYNHDDGDFADNLREKIKEAGFEPWIDIAGLHAGEDWRAEIDQAIKEAAALIVVMTPKAKESEYVTYEWAFAWGAGVKVIPVLLKPTELHPRLETLHYLDFTNRMARPWDKLIEALQKAVDDAPQMIRVPLDIPPEIKRVVTGAVAALSSASPTERKAAIESLAQTDHLAAREALAEAVQHPVRDVRIHAALVLVQSRDARAIPGLIEALRDKDYEVRQAAARGLGQIGDTTTVPKLIDTLHDEKEIVGVVAAKALGQIGDATAMLGLLNALRDRGMVVRYYVRDAIVEALKQIRDTAAVPSLIEALHVEDPHMGSASAEALGQIGEAAVPDLIEALGDKDGIVRWYAAKTLGRIGNAAAVPGLVEQLSDTELLSSKQLSDAERCGLPSYDLGGNTEYIRVCDVAAEALRRIGTPEALSAVEEWRRRDTAATGRPGDR